MKYRLRPTLVEATQWLKNGDHPGDGRERFTEGEFKGELLEGKVVRYYRHPLVPGDQLCGQCRLAMDEHGWIDSGGTGQTVCPGDFVITLTAGKYGVMKPDIFVETYTKDHG